MNESKIQSATKPSEVETPEARSPLSQAVTQFREAAAAAKCWPCGCLHNSLKVIDQGFPDGPKPKELEAALHEARTRLVEVRYDCLGCPICYPALAVNALQGVPGSRPAGFEACPTEKVEGRAGWPPLPGNYTVVRFLAPVAICTLTDEALAQALARAAGPGVALVGTLQTENLGIERLIQNTVSNPNIRFLLVCGPDSRQTIGHLPGQSLMALAQWGLDERGRIVGAKGKRPYLKNLSSGMVQHFRRTVAVVDLIANNDVSSVLKVADDCAQRSQGPSEPFEEARTLHPLKGYMPDRMVSDPAGYFVVFADHARGSIWLEHYRNDGVLDVLIEGRTAAELYFPAIEKGLISRLDHAAYLGRELAQAERALKSGQPFVQDAAAERPRATLGTCGCSSACQENP